MSNEEERSERVLAVVNVARVAVGNEPLARLPQGFRKESSRCPIAVAIGHEVNVTGLHASFYFSELEDWDTERIRRWWGTEECSCGWSFCVPLPEVVAEWIHDFDKGLLPEYEEDPAEHESRGRLQESVRLTEKRHEMEADRVEQRLGFPEHGRARRFA